MTKEKKLEKLNEKINCIIVLMTSVSERKMDAAEKEDEYAALKNAIDEYCVAFNIPVPTQFPSLTDFYIFFRSKLQTPEEKRTCAHKIYEKTLSEIMSLEEKLAKSQPAATDEDQRAQFLFEQMITHSEIKKVSIALFQGRNYRNAVLDAAIRLEELIKIKANYPKDNKGRELSGVNLMHRVFDSSHPIISWCKNNTQIEKDELEGYKLIFAGTVLGIRDTKAHAVFEINPMRALKLLVLITLLAELVDASKVM